MLKILQDIFIWLYALPYSAKILVSGAILLLACALVVVIWEGKSGSATNSSEPAPRTTPAPAPTMVINVFKTIWPEAKTLEGLKRVLDRTSKTNREILLMIVNSGRDGVNVSGPESLEENFRLSRNDLLYRGQRLESLHLIEIVSLPETNYRLNEDVWDVVGLDGIDMMRSLLI